jgi:type II secretion system protein G
MTKKNKGFTLIELLVVVAILGLLATIVAVSLTSARARARDSRRVSDVRQIELALELYYAAHEQYPDSSTSGLGALVSEGFLNMTAFPEDPNTGNKYCYAVGTDSSLASSRQRQYYHIGAVLENTDSDMLGDDLDYESISTGTISWALNSSNDCFVGTTDGFQGDEAVSGAEGTYDRGVTP